MLDSVDCSAFIRNVYKCFGLEMPRNTNWQKCVPGTAVDISELDEASKAAVISTITPGTPLYMSGHTMIYLGTVDGRNYVISAMGSASDSAGELEVKSQNSVTVTPPDRQTPQRHHMVRKHQYMRIPVVCVWGDEK